MSKSEAELIELAGRCERATGPDRELDAEIAKAVGYEVEWATIGPDHRREELVQVRTYPGELSPTSRNLRRYTASIDAAMTLVPEGYFWTGGTHPEFGAAMVVTNDPDSELNASKAATPALALAAAALKARATQSVSEDDTHD